MRENRTTLEIGAKIKLGENQYEVLGIVGAGSNAIVYHAQYPDQMQSDCNHQVLIKELFPYTTDGSIYRAEGGEQIVVEERGKEYFQLHKSSFYIGNKTHMAHLWENPEAAGGNINSYEKNGTLYSVYSYDGGISLEQYLEENKKIDLEQSCTMIQNLLDVLATFHNNGVLHLDISPDNILLLPLLKGKKEIQRRILLIDYNSSWNRTYVDLEGMYSGTKRGYSAPEIMLKKVNFICPATDLFSVCAVFYQMITGKRLTEEEIQNRKLRQFQIERCSVTWLSSVKWKVLEIITKGLWLTPNMRYQTTEELKEALIDLQDRIQRRGVSKSVLWEISKRQCTAYEKTRKISLYQSEAVIQWNEKIQLTEAEFWNKVYTERKSVLLTGSGGVGKTTLLFRYWKKMTNQYFEKQPVVWYLPLLRYQNWKNKKNSNDSQQKVSFLRGCLLEEIKTNDQVHSIEDAVWVLNQLMDQENQLILLLDGLNEVSISKTELLKEIHELSQKQGVQIVLTERVNTVTKLGIQSLIPCEIQPLGERQVREILQEQEILYPLESAMQQLLKNQMMMELYIEVKKSSIEMELEKEITPNTTSALFSQYYKTMCQKIEKTMVGMENQILCTEYALEHTLPMIAVEMKRKKERVLSYEEMILLLEENYKNLKKKTFLLAFPKYLGTSTCILQEMETVQAWYQFAVNEILIGKLKWLLPLDGGYTMFHQDFEVYLAYRGELQKKQWNVWQKKAVRKKTIAIALITLVLTVGGIHVWMQHSYPFFQRDKTKVQNSVENIAGILGKTYSMIQSQYQILKKISPSLLDGIQSQYDILEQEYQRLEQQAELYASITMNDSTYLTLIEDLRLSIPQKEAEELYTSAQLQCQFMQEHMSNLMNRLNPEKQYEREKKEKAISAYEQYLEAYCNWMNQRIAFVMEAYPERYRELLYQTLYTSPYFSAIQGKSEQELKNGIEETERELANQERNLSLNGL